MGNGTAVKIMKRILFFTLLVTVISQIPGIDAGEDGMADNACCVVPVGRVDVIQKPSQEVYQPEMIMIEAEDTWISEEYQEYCRKAGERYRICPELLMAMIERESSGNADAVNSEGDTGLLQVNERWHYSRMEKLGVTDLYEPYSNILVAADYLAELFEQNQDPYLVLMKYNMSHNAAEELYEQGIYSEYAIKVTERAWELEMLHGQEGE